MEAGSSNLEVIQKTIRILGVSILVSILIYFLAKNTEGISIALKDDSISLSYSSGDSFDIWYKDILSAEETQDLDLGKYVSGIESKNHKFGIWDNKDFLPTCLKY